MAYFGKTSKTPKIKNGILYVIEYIIYGSKASILVIALYEDKTHAPTPPSIHKHS